MHSLAPLVLACASLVTVAGCVGGLPGLHGGPAGSVCSGDDECGSDLVCEGRCIRLCSRSSECADLGARAYCATGGTCTWHCETDADCPTEHDCGGGVCIARPVPG